MRRQSIFFSLISFIVLILGSCTLSMEEWVMPEEERGVHEPYTVKTDVAEVTYQFNEGVKPITKKVMEYFVASEADTVLYFSDNVRKDWIPEVGGVAVIGCNMEYPLGYAGRVLERTNANGMTRIVTTPATQEEIYKKLDYTIEADVRLFDIPEDWEPEDYTASSDSVENEKAALRALPVSRANLNKNAYIDYSLVKDECPELYEWQMKQHFPSHVSRAEKEPVEKENDTEELKAISFKINSEKKVSITLTIDGLELPLASDVDLSKVIAVISKNREKIDKLKADLDKDNPFLSAKASYELVIADTTTTHFHAQRNEDTKYEEEYKIEDSKFSVTNTLEFALEGDKVIKQFPVAKVRDERDQHAFDIRWEREIDKALAALTDEKIPFEKSKLLSFPKAIVVFGATGLTITVDVEFGFEMGLTGAGTIKYSSQKWTKTGTKKKNGESSKIYDTGYIVNGNRISSKPNSTNNSSSWDINFIGKAKAGLYLQVTAMLNYLKCFSIGAKVKGGVGLQAEMTTENNIPGSYNDYASSKNYVKPYAEITISGIAEVSALGLPIYENEKEFVNEEWFENVKWNFEPTFPSSMKTLTADFTSSDKGVYVNGSYRFERTGLNPFSKFYEPRLLVYKKQTPIYKLYNWEEELELLNEQPVAVIKPTNVTSYLQTKLYNFNELVPNIEEAREYIVLPALCRPTFDYYLFYPQQAKVIESGRPSLAIKEITQTIGREPTMQECTDMKIYSNPGIMYEFAVVNDITLGSKLKKIIWEIAIFNKETDKLVIPKQVVTNSRAFKSGRYIDRFKFLYTPRTPKEILKVYLTPMIETKNGSSEQYTYGTSEFELRQDLSEDVHVYFMNSEEVKHTLKNDNAQ